MAKDNNNINIADELSSSSGGSNKASSSSADALKQQGNTSRPATTTTDQQPLNYGGRAGGGGGGRTNGVLLGSQSADGGSGGDLQQQQTTTTINFQRSTTGSSGGPADSETGAIPELPRREENPFSFKHFLKRDSSLGSASASSSGVTSNGTIINHSRSTSNINGNNHNLGSSSFNSLNNSNNLINNNNMATGSSILSSTGICNASASPSKSATTSSLHNTSTTGAKPKIPQFQSVNTLSSESKMKRSPRFPSFDSQSSLSDLADDKFMSNIYHSRSNNSFNSDYPLGGGGSTSGGSQYVQRSYSNYDMESPGSADSPRLAGSQNLHNSPNFGGRSRENLASTHRLGTSEFSAALPDFVQDHLVMEQWYTLGGSPKSVSPVSVDFDQLPDFTVNNLDAEAGGRGHGPIINDMPFDLTYNSAPAGGANPASGANLNSSNRNRTPLRNTSPNVPLDLPPQNLDFSFDLPRRRVTPPPELPPDLTDNNTSGPRSGFYFSDMDRNHSPPASGSAADKIHRLPDFLSDGPIHSSGRLADVTHDTPHFNSPDADASHHQQRLQIERQENDRLRREVEDNRRIIAEQARRIKDLEKTVETAKSNASLAQTVEGFEGNLDKSYLRATTAETQVIKLRQKIKRLNAEIETLRQENDILKEEGAVGGTGAGVSDGACGGGAPSGVAGSRGFSAARHNSRRPFSRAQELSHELRQAAASAESNLRQLLTGVDNLRMMASTIENIERIDITHPDDFLSDSDDNDLLGPAL
ncbi:bromodomain-containing protein DDB_G0270170 [Aedes aegypti]|uniref:Endosome-associated-trafficking regulator 1 n=2 Tax=Aedes aegypti TaxID=7159 RepID=A0A903TWX7_AEDAE|nr:bromodomain-containing protein DDB_G0270170 [Aedes aegypti]